MKKFIVRGGLAAGVALCSGLASASPCDSVLSSYESYVSSGLTTNAGQVLSSHPECFGGSSTSSRTFINTSSFTQSSAISSALASRLASDGPVALASSAASTGMAAGGVAGKLNVWGNVTQNNSHHNYMNLNNAITNGKNDVLTMVFGADYALTQNIVAGVSAALDDGNGMGANTGGGIQNRTDNHGYVLAPYIGIQLMRDLSLDASVGMGSGKLSTSGNTESKADRFFAATNLVYSRWFGPLQVMGKASYLHGEEDYDNIRDTQTNLRFRGTSAKNKIDQMRVGGQVGYWMNGFMPYASLGYVSDVHRSTTQFGGGFDPIGKNAWLAGVGVNFISVANKLTAGVAYNQEFGRSNQVSNHSLMANLNIRF